MFKKILVATLLVAVCLCGMTGGYHAVDTNELKELLQDSSFIKADNEARSYVESTNGGNLGKIVKVETQVVQGINYKITYKTSTGPIQVVVWSKPWEETNKVMGVYRNIQADEQEQ